VNTEQDQVEARRYRILQLLGEGGFGKVYRARLEGAEGFYKDVAIKLLHSEAEVPEEVLQRFRDEARILGLIRDRAIVGVDPPTRLGGKWAVVMEFVDGASASHLLKRGVLPPGVAAEVVGEVARALDKVWSQPGVDGKPLHLLHRDIKPPNIQVTRGGEVKILDFGIARAAFANREAKTTDHIGGTFGYIAPERLEGEEGPEGDVYSLGVVLHQLVTGEAPKPRLRTVDPAISDPSLRKVLELSVAMRSLDPEDRPSSREVEVRCREIRGASPPPFLREWAEANVHEIEPGDAGEAGEADELVGEMLTETVATLPLAGSVPEEPAAPGRSEPPVVVEEDAPKGSAVKKVALAAGGTAIALVVGGAVVVVGLVALIVLLIALPGDSEVVIEEPAGDDGDPGPVLTEGGAVIDASGYRLVAVEGGSFWMGSPETDEVRGDDEVLHPVELSRGYWLGSTEVTQELYRAVVGEDPSLAEYDGRSLVGEGMPVQRVSWFDAVRFCNELSAREGREPAYTISGSSVSWSRDADGYRLPTEAEWEHAARLGTARRFSGTSDPERVCAYANVADISARRRWSDWEVIACEDGFPVGAPVGSLRPNAWGLYDLTGNVSEWVWDAYDDYPEDEVVDPAPDRGSRRVARGGSWLHGELKARATYREARDASDADGFLGFRVARNR